MAGQVIVGSPEDDREQLKLYMARIDAQIQNGGVTPDELKASLRLVKAAFQALNGSNVSYIAYLTNGAFDLIDPSRERGRI